MGESEEEHRLIAAGFGGQGVLTLGRLICLAAIREGRNVTYLPAYGPEVRGGTANCQVVISNQTIYSPLVESPHTLIILNQLSYERFAPDLRPGGLILINSSGVDLDGLESPDEAELHQLPATEMAAEMGEVRVANVILLGALAEHSGLVKGRSCAHALRELMGKRKPELVELNLQALRRGAEMAAGWREPAGGPQ